MKVVFFAALFSIAMLACSPARTAPGSAAPSSTAPALAQVTVAMGYIPNVQFAPFFVADKKGYFAAQGLKIKYDWGFEIDGVKLVGVKQIDFAVVSADQIIQARAQGIPITYVANWYNAFPIEIISLKDRGIAKPQDLVGKKVGMPCLCGATYTAWRALLYTQKLDPAAINVQDIGFTQVQALSQGTVDAVGVYANNEPVQLRLAGKEINEIKTWEYTQLVGNGIATNDDTVRHNPDLVKRFVHALVQGIADSVTNPDEALSISIAAVPEAARDQSTSKAVLDASIPLWKNSTLGESRLADWQAMEKFMFDAGFIQKHVDLTQSFTNRFVGQ